MLKFNSNNKFQIRYQILEPSKDLQVTGVKDLKFPCKVRNTKVNNNNKANHNNNLKPNIKANIDLRQLCQIKQLIYLKT